MEPPDADRHDGLLERLRYWCAIYVALGTIAGTVAGGVAIGLAKLTVYYLAEEASIQKLADLRLDSEAFTTHLQKIDDVLRDQRNIDQELTKAIAELNVHVHALDERADTSMRKVSDQLGTQNKNSEQILLLLQPQPSTKKIR